MGFKLEMVHFVLGLGFFSQILSIRILISSSNVFSLLFKKLGSTILPLIIIQESPWDKIFHTRLH